MVAPRRMAEPGRAQGSVPVRKGHGIAQPRHRAGSGTTRLEPYEPGEAAAPSQRPQQCSPAAAWPCCRMAPGPVGSESSSQRPRQHLALLPTRPSSGARRERSAELPVREHPLWILLLTCGSAFLRACYRPHLLETHTIKTLKSNIQVFKVNKRYWKETRAV